MSLIAFSASLVDSDTLQPIPDAEITISAPTMVIDGEVHPKQRWPLTTDTDGDAADDLPVPPTGTAHYRIQYPGGSVEADLSAAMGSVTLADLIRAAQSAPVDPDALLEHAGQVASTTTRGHVKVDGTTILIDADGVISAVGGPGGASTFAALTDTPGDYTGQAGRVVAVKSDVSGLEFVDAQSGPQGPAGADGADGADGASAYEVAVSAGFVGNEAAWLASLVGADGQDGATGADGQDGATGAAGPQGVQGPAGADGADGADGDSAYEVAVAAGFAGDETAWLASLVGAKGDTGDQGPQGIQGVQGPAGADGADGQDGATGPAGPGLPSGGAVGTVAVKQSATDYDFLLRLLEISDVNDLQTALNGKAASSHTHPVTDLSDSTAAGRALLTAADAQTARDVLDAVAIDDLVVNALDHGVAGDDTTDDTAALEAALVSAVGGTLYLPPLTYRCAGVVDVPSNVRILGYGATLRNDNPTDSTDSDKLPVLRLLDVTDVQIAGLTIDGNRTRYATWNEWNHGIQLHGTESIVLRDLAIASCNGDGIILEGETSARHNVRIRIDRMDLSDNARNGMSICDGLDVAIQNLWTHHNGKTVANGPNAGLDIEPDHDAAVVQQIAISDSDFADNDQQGMVAVLRQNSTTQHGLRLTRCTFRRNGGGTLMGDVAPNMSLNQWARDVTFVDCTIADGAENHGTLIRRGCRDVTFLRCGWAGNYYRAVNIDLNLNTGESTTGRDLANIQFIACVMRGNAVGAGGVPIIGVTQSAATTTTLTGLMILGCTLTSGGANTHSTALTTTSGVSGLTLRDSDLSGNTAAASLSDDTATRLVRNVVGLADTTHTQAWSTITGTPTTLAGYGITDAAGSSHTHPATQISDSTTAGRALLTAADAAAQRTALSVPTTSQALAMAVQAFNFDAAGSLFVKVKRAGVLAASTAGTGSAAYKKNGTTTSAPITVAVDDEIEVVASGVSGVYRVYLEWSS